MVLAAAISLENILLLVFVATVMHVVLLAPVIVAILGALGEKLENDALRRGDGDPV